VSKDLLKLYKLAALMIATKLDIEVRTHRVAAQNCLVITLWYNMTVFVSTSVPSIVQHNVIVSTIP
jgi:hypothetical protein